MKTINKIKSVLSVKLMLYIPMFCVVVLFSACEDQLTEQPQNFYSTEDFFKNTDRLRMAVNGVYEVFSNQATYGQYWMVYDTDTDISFVNGSGTGHVARDLGHYNIYVEHSWLQESWQLYYQGIDRANTILENMAKVEIKDTADQKVFNELVAETRSLRAMCYFDLVLLFGDAPLKTNASKAQDNFKLARTDRQLIFDLIEEDFKAAIPHLKYAADQSGAYNGRFNKGAAMGMLARVNLFRAGYFLAQDGTMKRYDNYKEYYQNVIDITDELITSGKHSLLSSYETVFRNMCELKSVPTENIWEVPFFNAIGEKPHTSMMGTYNGPVISDKSIYGRANSFIKTHNFFYDLYQPTDLRRNVAVAKFQIKADNSVTEYSVKTSFNWAPGKWRRNWQTGAVKDNNNTDVNWVLIRYADVLLMRAEAENEINGVTPIAVEYLNKIRRRAFGFNFNTPEPTVDYKVSDFVDAADFRAEIVDERARELCFEGMRRQDLIRWNLLETKIMETDAKIKAAIANGQLNSFIFTAAQKFTTGKHELYPIPAYERRETNNMISQNPNYNQ
ncbi:MAG: RagB/SusD family nutrient uptake outer membrane protein [Bacteroidia bacterium]|nr:RagB/SusD family nutrient uptake outer membrane protein [Bacteroidia bacterium]